MIEIVCIAIFSIELLSAIVLQIAQYRLPKSSNSAPIKAISFIIPFHNEAERILPLIQSINTSEFTGECEFIFVDDYSTDATVHILEQLNVSYTCVQNKYKKGKKRAIQTGVLVAKHEFIVTWDADIYFEPNYIENLFTLPLADLIILPVKMTASTLTGKLACIEFSFIETFNLGFAGIRKPIACNGANLGFNKSVFLDLSESRKDYNVPSGDDMFLMWAMDRKNKSINVYKHSSLAVSTPAPANFLELIRQRQRWKGKMKAPNSFETFYPFLLQFSVFMACFLTLLIALDEPIFYCLFALKIVAELIASWSFVRRHYSHLFVLIIHQVWYPIYALFVIALPLKKEKRWS